MNAFGALADDTRRTIVEILARQGELSASDIGGHFPISAPSVSQHLKILREAKVIRMRRLAQKRLYSVDRAGLGEISHWLEDVERVWQRRLDQLDAFLLEQKRTQEERT